MNLHQQNREPAPTCTSRQDRFVATWGRRVATLVQPLVQLRKAENPIPMGETEGTGATVATCSETLTKEDVEKCIGVTIEQPATPAPTPPRRDDTRNLGPFFAGMCLTNVTLDNEHYADGSQTSTHLQGRS